MSDDSPISLRDRRTERRYGLLAELDALESKLASLPKDIDAAERSVEHCAVQVSYWRCMHALASVEYNDALQNGGESRKGWMSDSHALLLLNRATEHAEKWERCKSQAEKVRMSDRLARVLENQERRKHARDKLGAIKAKKK